MARLLFAAIASIALTGIVSDNKLQRSVTMEYDPVGKCIRAKIGDAEATAEQFTCDFDKSTLAIAGTNEHPAQLVLKDGKTVVGGKIIFNQHDGTIRVEAVKSATTGPASR